MATTDKILILAWGGVEGQRKSTKVAATEVLGDPYQEGQEGPQKMPVLSQYYESEADFWLKLKLK